MGITARLCPFTPSCVQRFLISGGQFKNRCKVMPVYALLCAAIPDFRGYTWESLQGYARLRPLACSDSGFQGAIWESLQGYCPFTPLACSDSLFEGVNLGIAARLCPFTSSCVQRFLISGQDLRIDAAEKSSACSGRSGNEVRVRFYSSLPRRRMVPPAAVVATTKNSPPAAPSWGACPRRINAPRPNIIFFAAKWNGSACRSRRDNEE